MRGRGGCMAVSVWVMGTHRSDECQPARSSTTTQDHSIVGRVTQEFTCTLYHTLHGSNCATVIHSLCVVSVDYCTQRYRDKWCVGSKCELTSGRMLFSFIRNMLHLLAFHAHYSTDAMQYTTAHPHTHHTRCPAHPGYWG